MAVILNEKKSTYGSPYCFYKVETTNIENRTATTVDITFKITSHLQYSSSSLGANYNLTGGLYLNGVWHNFAIKQGESWSGTTNHVKNVTIIVNNLGSSDILISDIKFRSVSSASDNASGLNATACANITIESYHTPPLISGYTITETNQSLINAGVSDDLFVVGLSKKSFNINYTLYEDASLDKATIYNALTYIYQSNSLPVLMDLTNNPIEVRETTEGGVPVLKVPIMVSIFDSEDGRTYYTNAGEVNNNIIYDYYNYITYIKPNFTSTTKAKRIGQISGRVGLDIEGVYYNGIIGNIDQTSYKPTIKYKYWKYGDVEPVNYTNTIASSNISINNGTFSVSSLDIGSTIETDPNYFDPESAYRIKLYIEDNFTNAESNELQIQVGEAVWTEYPNRVDFKKLSIGGDIVDDYIVEKGGSSSTNYYIKYASGLMVQYGQVQVSVAIQTAMGSVFRTATETQHNLEVSFYNTDYVVNLTANPAINSAYIGLKYVDNFTIWPIAYTSTSAYTRYVDFIAIGRWK